MTQGNHQGIVTKGRSVTATATSASVPPSATKRACRNRRGVDTTLMSGNVKKASPGPAEDPLADDDASDADDASLGLDNAR